MYFCMSVECIKMHDNINVPLCVHVCTYMSVYLHNYICACNICMELIIIVKINNLNNMNKICGIMA